MNTEYKFIGNCMKDHEVKAPTFGTGIKHYRFNCPTVQESVVVRVVYSDADRVESVSCMKPQKSCALTNAH